MFICCSIHIHRHQLHLATYGCVSLSLILAGFVFTVFAIFHKDSQIGKIWLAGPVLIVVGAVLCGKVMIDWGPAMRQGRTGSLDSRLIDELAFSNLISTGKKPRSSLTMGGCPTTDFPKARPHFSSPSASSSGHHLPPTHPSLFPYRFSSSSYPPPFHNIHPNNVSSHPPHLPPPTSNCAFSEFPSSSSNSLSSPPNSISNAPSDDAPFDRIIYSPSDQLEEEEKDRNRNGKIRNKFTQSVEYAKNGGCERCATLWTHLEGERRTEGEHGREVMGRRDSGRRANYGTMLRRGQEEMWGDTAEGTHCQQKSDQNGSHLKAHSQGETLIMNERSFLI